MASAKKKAAKAQKAAVKARYNPYVQKVVEDEDLRQSIVQAYESSRDAFAAPEQRQVALQADLRRQEAAEGPQGGRGEHPRRRRDAPRGARSKRKGGFGRLLLLGLVGGAVALAVSEGLRKKVLDALFGAEEEFEYTSTTTSSPSPQTAGTTT